ncbi:MAG: hypothetical protein R3E01_00315 [Pirellulaceae bacterium]|nr:hypothetical protein [Planctomycetales bacterium]
MKATVRRRKRGAYVPSPADIQRVSREIRMGWSEHTRVFRRSLANAIIRHIASSAEEGLPLSGTRTAS